MTQSHMVVKSNNGARNLTYENNGNLTVGFDFSKTGQFPERRLAYNAENMPLSIAYTPEGGTARTTALTYDGDSRRVIKDSGENRVIYVDETYEIRNGQPVKYVFAGSMRVAEIRDGQVRYYHKDHLGSAAVATDASGHLLESLVYEAYGQPRPTCQTQTGTMAYTYTDQEWDAETGLYNYDARLYDAVLGRFLTADSVVPNWFDPQALNRYAYARNNPLKNVDPDGHSFIEAIPGTIAAVTGYGGIAIAYAFSRPAIGLIWLIDRSGAAQANQGLNDAFRRAVIIHTEYVAAPDVAGDVAGAVIGAGVKYVKAARQAARTATEVAENAGQATSTVANAGSEVLPGSKGASSLYEDATRANSRYVNRATDVTKSQFEKNLVDSGFTRSVSKDGKAIILQKDGAKYILRDAAKSTGGPTADYYKAGSNSIDLKIRLGD